MQVDEGWAPLEVRQPDPQSPAGGVSSTVNDLSKWLILQLSEGEYEGEQIVDSIALNQTHLPHIVSQEPADPSLERAGFYGLGWGVGYDAAGLVRLSHSGAFALGAATVVNLIPASSLGIVILTNGAPIGVPESIGLTFLDLVAFGEPQFDYFPLLGPVVEAAVAPEYGDELVNREPGGAPPLDLSAYVGIYANDFFGPLQIELEGDGLVMSYGPIGFSFPLAHFSNDVFSYQPVGENAVGLSAVTFTIDPTGQAEHVSVENLDIHGSGTFLRESG